MHQEQSHDTKIYVVQQYVPMSMELCDFYYIREKNTIFNTTNSNLR